MKLSKKSLIVLQNLFGDKSNLQVPAQLLDNALEIRNWVEEELKSEQKDAK